MGIAARKINIFDSKSSCLFLVAIWVYSFWPTILADCKAYIHTGYDYQGLLVLPTLLLLLIRKDNNLRRARLHYNPLGLLFLLLCAVAWLFATIIESEIIRQISALSMLFSIVLTTCGEKFTSVLIVPFLCLFFLLPVGQEVTGALRNIFFKTLVHALILSKQTVYWESHKIVVNNNFYDISIFVSSLKYILLFTAIGACCTAFVTKSIKNFLAITICFISAPISLLCISIYSYIMLKMHVTNLAIIDNNLMLASWVINGVGILSATIFAAYLLNRKKTVKHGDEIDWHNNYFNTKKNFITPLIIGTTLLLLLPTTATKIKHDEQIFIHIFKSKS